MLDNILNNNITIKAIIKAFRFNLIKYYLRYLGYIINLIAYYLLFRFDLDLDFYIYSTASIKIV